jgi:hypothetical protein
VAAPVSAGSQQLELQPGLREAAQPEDALVARLAEQSQRSQVAVPMVAQEQ